MKYGMKESDILSWKAWNNAVNIFWNKIIEFDMQDLFVCLQCGPRPDALVFDGIAQGKGV